MGTLYECLREARLDKYFPILRINGITTSESLANLSQEDCTAIGVSSPGDRRRLIDLINIIKSVHANRHSPVDRNTNNKNGQRKRNRSPAIRGASSNTSVPELHLSGLALPHSVKVKENRPGGQSSSDRRIFGAHAPEMFSETESSDEDEGDDSSDHSDYEPAKKHVNAVPPAVSSVVRKSKVKQHGGYNYGVPKSSPHSASKSRARTSESQKANDEKIKVCVRKRPLNKREVKSGETDIVNAESTTTIIVNESKHAVDLSAYTLQVNQCAQSLKIHVLLFLTCIQSTNLIIRGNMGLNLL